MNTTQIAYRKAKKIRTITQHQLMTHNEICAIGFNQPCDCHVRVVEHLVGLLNDARPYVQNFPEAYQSDQELHQGSQLLQDIGQLFKDMGIEA